MTGNRRQFLQAAAATAASRQRISGANDRVRIGGIGVGGRCSYLLATAQRVGGCEIVALCDVYSTRLAQAREKIAPGAKEYADYKELLDNKDIDAVVIGSPDHWHARMTMDAVAAGKDVYVEKPVTHTGQEGVALEQAVRVSNRVVQAGYQQRSWRHFLEARDLVASGMLGKITLVLASWYQNYVKITEHKPEVDAAAVDWKRFLGSAPEQPFDPLRFTHWRWFWDFGGGHLTDLYSHYGDVIQWYMGEDTPVEAQAMGRNVVLKQFQCPDTIAAVYAYPAGHMVTYHGTLSGSLDGGNILFRGTKAMMKLNRDGFAVYEEGGVPFEKTFYPEPLVAARTTGDGTVDHMANFLDCVRTRKTPNAPIQIAVAAANAAHLGNAAMRRGQRLQMR